MQSIMGKRLHVLFFLPAVFTISVFTTLGKVSEGSRTTMVTLLRDSGWGLIVFWFRFFSSFSPSTPQGHNSSLTSDQFQADRTGLNTPPTSSLSPIPSFFFCARAAPHARTLISHSLNSFINLPLSSSPLTLWSV